MIILMKPKPLAVVFAVFFALAASCTGAPLDRVALIVGNNDYADVPLDNAVEDALAIKTMLTGSLGFPAAGIVHVENANRLEIFDAFERFKTLAGEAKIALVYYAGHGMESLDGKENFLIPVDAPIVSRDPKVVTIVKSEASLRAAGVSLMALTSDLAAATNGAKIILMDCCRERPAGRGSARAGGGLAIYSDGQIPADTLMILAAAPTRAASDGEEHGPFTAALLDVLPKEDDSLLDAFFAVSDKVQKDTAGQQVPWLRFDGSGQVFRERSFLGRGVSGKVTVKAEESPEVAAMKRELDEAKRRLAEADAMKQQPVPVVPSMPLAPSGALAPKARTDPSSPNGFPAARASESALPKSALKSYDSWQDETVNTFGKLLVQREGHVTPIESLAQFTLLEFLGDSAVSFITGDGKQHNIRASAWLLDALFRGELAKNLPVFRIDTPEVALRIGVPFDEKSSRYSYNDLYTARDMFAKLVAQYEESGKENQLNPIESGILALGRNIRSFEYFIGQFGFARRDGLLVNANIFPPELAELDKRLDVVELLDKMPEMTRDRLVEMIRQEPGSTEEDRLFSSTLLLFYFHAYLAQGLHFFPPQDPNGEVWISVGDLLLDGLASKEKRPWVREQLATVQGLTKAHAESEAAFVAALKKFGETQRVFPGIEGADKISVPSKPPAEIAETSGTGAAALVFDVPDGWTEKPGSKGRDLNFTLGPNEEGECYLGRVAAAGRSLLEIVNSWRSEMGAPPLVAEEVAALPSRHFFGRPARFVSINGTFSPEMDSAQKYPDYRLVGLILAGEAGAVFVKMTGPSDLVDHNAAAFEKFVSSIDFK